MLVAIPKRTQIRSVCLKYPGPAISFSMCRSAFIGGHILDLVINREGDGLVSVASVSCMLSDHFVINTKVSLEWPFSPATSVSFRSYRLIDINAFLLDLKDTQLLLDPPKGLDCIV